MNQILSIRFIVKLGLDISLINQKNTSLDVFKT